jgi:putative membrane protein
VPARSDPHGAAAGIGLWLLIALYAATTVIPRFVPAFGTLFDVALSVAAAFAFACIHGSIRYRLGGIIVFFGIGLLVSNVMENLSIVTGFPFGHYYYTANLGPKLFLVPLLIGPAYLGTGYVAWTLASVILDGADRRQDLASIVGLPVVAAFIMTSWDVCFDPTLSTIAHDWIWRNGGGYFGVPLVNYLGWFLTVYIFYQFFALYLAGRSGIVRTGQPKTYWYQAVVFFFVVAVGYPAAYFGGRNHLVTDATGATWRTRDIYETAAIVSIYTLLFVSVLSFLKIARSGAGSKHRAVHHVN